MSDKYRLVAKPNDDVWQNLLDASPQGTLFSERFYLDLSDVQYERYLVLQGNSVKGGLCVVVDPSGLRCILDDLVIYSGVFFNPDPTKRFVKRRFEEFEITEYILSRLIDIYRDIDIAFAPQLTDMRPILWCGYHENDASKKFKIDLRYTSYIDISSLTEGNQEDSSLFREMETLRQRHIRDAVKNGGRARIGNSSKLLVEFYRELMLRQCDPASEDKLSRINALLNGLLDNKRAMVIEVLNKSETVIYSVLYAWDKKRSYYLFGAGNPIASEPWQGTLAHWHAFIELAKLGIYEVDMEGVNSPKRGWFKLSFGGKLMPYYQVSYGKNIGISHE